MHPWYDPHSGRWISDDPIGFAAGDANLYRYVGNGVTTLTDPTGLERCVYCSVGPDPNWPLPFPSTPALPSGIHIINVPSNTQWDKLGHMVFDFLTTSAKDQHVRYRFGEDSVIARRLLNSDIPVFEAINEWLNNGAKEFCSGRCKNATYSTGIVTVAQPNNPFNYLLDGLSAIMGTTEYPYNDFRIQVVGVFGLTMKPPLIVVRGKPTFVADVTIRGQLTSRKQYTFDNRRKTGNMIWIPFADIPSYGFLALGSCGVLSLLAGLTRKIRVVVLVQTLMIVFFVYQDFVSFESRISAHDATLALVSGDTIHQLGGGNRLEDTSFSTYVANAGIEELRSEGEKISQRLHSGQLTATQAAEQLNTLLHTADEGRIPDYDGIFAIALFFRMFILVFFGLVLALIGYCIGMKATSRRAER